MDESKLDKNRIGRKPLDQNRLDENRLDENWAHGNICIDKIEYTFQILRKNKIIEYKLANQNKANDDQLK